MKDAEPKTTRVVVALVGLMAALTIAYVLSVGPVFVIANRGHMSLKTVDAIYAPLIFVVDRSESLSRLLNWYLKTWVSIDKKFPYDSQVGDNPFE